MKPLLCLFTDTHLEKEEQVPLNISVARQVIKYARETGCKNIAHGGDVFTDRKRITLDENLLPFDKILDEFADSDLVLDTIPGNHDKTSQVRDESYLDVYKHHPGIRLHSKESFRKSNDVYICFLPYYLEKDGTYGERLLNLVNELKKVKKKGEKAILVTHVAVNGVQNNDGSRVEGEVKFKHFSIFDLVLVGHYHDRQEFKKGNTRIIYIGSAFQNNFGEDSEKGFAVVYPDLSVEYVKTDFPHYYKEIYNLPKDSKKMKLKTLHYKKRKEKGDKYYARFIIRGNQESLVSVDTEYLKSLDIDVVKETATMLKNIENAEKGESFIFNNKGILKGFEDFCDENGIEGKRKEFGLDRLKKYV